MAKWINLQSDESLNGKVSRLKPVQDAVKEAADGVFDRAKADLASRQKSGKTQVEQVRVKGKYKTIDWEIALVGKNVVALEYGHQPSGIFEDTETKPPAATYILHKAAGLA